jgi:hypothetical protein
MTPPGFVVLGIRRAFYANPGRELTTRELWGCTHPREVHWRDRFRRKNISRAIRAAADRMCVDRDPIEHAAGVVRPAPTAAARMRPFADL